MKSRILITFLNTIVFASSMASAQPGGGMGAVMPGQSIADNSNPSLSCLIKIDIAPEILALNPEILQTLLNSPFIKEFNQKLDDSDFLDNVMGNVNICVDMLASAPQPSGAPLGMMMATPGGGRSMPAWENQIGGQLYKIRLTSRLIDDETLTANAAEIFKQIATRLDTTLRQEFDKYLGELSRQREIAITNQNKTQNEMDNLQRSEMVLQEEAGQSNLSREAILNQMKDLENERQQLQMNLASLQARREAINRETAEISKRMEDKMGNDPVIGNLKEILELNINKRALAKQMVENGTAPQTEISEPEEKIARTQIEIAERQEELKKQAGGSSEKWSNELSEMAIQTAEMEARLNFVNNQLAQMKEKNLLALAYQYEREVVMKMGLVRETYEQAGWMVHNLQRQMDSMQPPSVTILGGQPEPEEKKAEEK
ncbi:MAG: Chromosome partition protein Smc [Planctomycetes bacterium ADurb.Bin412]|nr:MAG: Chromosome partition protein Smc [Planctomycetes bacterium ADurb.Bin412]